MFIEGVPNTAVFRTGEFTIFCGSSQSIMLCQIGVYKYQGYCITRLYCIYTIFLLYRFSRMFYSSSCVFCVNLNAPLDLHLISYRVIFLWYKRNEEEVKTHWDILVYENNQLLD